MLESFLITLQTQSLQIYKNTLYNMCFHVDFCEILKTTYFEKHLRADVSKKCHDTTAIVIIRSRFAGVKY